MLAHGHDTSYSVLGHSTPWSSITNVPQDLADGDDDTMYQAGFGLFLSKSRRLTRSLLADPGNTFRVDGTVMQRHNRTPEQLATLNWHDLTEFLARGNPTAIAFDGANIWVTNQDSDYINKLDADRTMVPSRPTP